MARLAGYCWRYPRNVILALAGTLVVSAVGIAIPLIQRAIVDNLTSSVQAAIWPLALALLVAAFANFGALYLRRYRVAGFPSTFSTTCAHRYWLRCPAWTAPARTSCTPARSSAAPSPTSPWSGPAAPWCRC